MLLTNNKITSLLRLIIKVTLLKAFSLELFELRSYK